MRIRQWIVGMYPSARALVRPAGWALAALVSLAACSSSGDESGERTAEAVSANLAGSTFEGNDGNLVVDKTGDTDWANVAGLNTGIDLSSGSTDNSFGQGTKEDSSSVTVVTGSIPPNKNDLTRFYEASEDVNAASFSIWPGSAPSTSATPTWTSRSTRPRRASRARPPVP